MLCSLFTRNSFLISGVVLSHLLILLGLLSGSHRGQKLSTQGILMVNLEGEPTTSPKSNKSIAPPQANSFSSKENSNLFRADESSSPIGIEISSQLAGGLARKTIHSPKPHYPMVSRQLREEGLVMVKLCVNEQGIVGEVGITKSSGFKNLDHSALNTLAKWRFSPIPSNSSSLASQCFQTPVQFTLEG